MVADPGWEVVRTGGRSRTCRKPWFSRGARGIDARSGSRKQPHLRPKASPSAPPLDASTKSAWLRIEGQGSGPTPQPLQRGRYASGDITDLRCGRVDASDRRRCERAFGGQGRPVVGEPDLGSGFRAGPSEGERLEEALTPEALEAARGLACREGRRGEEVDRCGDIRGIRRGDGLEAVALRTWDWAANRDPAGN